MAATKKTLIYLSQLLLYAGMLALSSRFPEAASVKAPMMVLALGALWILHLDRLVLSPLLLPFLGLWTYWYIRLTGLAPAQETAVALMGAFFAFMLGYMRGPLVNRTLLMACVLACMVRGALDLITLSHLGTDARSPAPMDAVTSFFLDKQDYGILLVLAAMFHFYLMDVSGPRRPVHVLLYSSTLLVLMSILLVDSRSVQGVFFLCFLPLLFLSVKLDGREPPLERLVWITGISLCLGLAWVNLPDRQLDQMALVFSHAPGFLRWAWASAWDTFLESPLFGAGTGAFRFAVIPYQRIWSPGDVDGSMTQVQHAHNHYLEVMAESGLAALAMEICLLGVALFSMARIYYREWRPEAKYAFFCLAALILQGMLCTVLEHAPTRFIYWALVGYGWSLAAESREPAARPWISWRFAKPALAAVTAGLLIMHLARRLPEFEAARLARLADSYSDSSPQRQTDLLVRALAADDRNESANYQYAMVLANFQRKEDAIKRLDYIHSFAPDLYKRGDALAQIYASLDRHDSAAHYSRVVLSKHPAYLVSLEILMDSYMRMGDCPSVDSLRSAANRLRVEYPMPDSKTYTIGNLDSLFHTNHDVNFLQRWFGGKSLKEKFVLRHLKGYNRKFKNHGRLRTLLETLCPPPSDLLRDPRDHAPGSPPRPKRKSGDKFRGWGRNPPLPAGHTEKAIG